jgi:homoaconitase
MIEEMMKEDLPNLVDERRFRRREPENFERDEFGRVRLPQGRTIITLMSCSANGLKRRSL